MNRIREVREAHGITQSVLHTKLGWKQSRLSNYETGVRSPGLDEARQIVTALQDLGAQCDLDDVFPADEHAA